MNTIFFLRSYGDFIVAIIAMKDSGKLRNVRCVASNHLKELFYALPKEEVPEGLQIRFYDFGVKHGIMTCFTDRYLFSSTTVNSLLKFRRIVKKEKFILNDNYPCFYLEQKKRLLLPVLAAGRKLNYLHTKGNIYDSYNHFFESRNKDEITFNQSHGKPVLILIFPGSRRKVKEIPQPVIEYIQGFEEYGTIFIKEALLNKSSDGVKEEKNKVYYSDFKELVNCILSANFIISSDSLSAHLSQLLGKPHWIMYNKVVNKEWLTPFTRKNGWSCCFNEYKKLESVLKEFFL